MNNKLIKTDTLWYKIKRVFKNIYNKDKFSDTYKYERNEMIKKADETFINKIDVKEKVEDDKRKKELAQKLIDNKIEIHDLTEKEIDEMIEYFTNDIEKMNKELLRIRNHILSMRREL